MLAINKYQEFKISDCDIKNLFISLGSLVVKNYSEVILQYDERLTSEIKRVLTLVINNLLICNQLQSRIFGLKEGINEANAKLEDLIYLNKNKKNEVQEQKRRFKKSLTIKEKRLFQLNQENINLLLKIGKWFYQEKLLVEKEEFNRLYSHLDYLLEDKETINDLDEVLVEKLDEEKADLYNLLQPYPNFLV